MKRWLIVFVFMLNMAGQAAAQQMDSLLTLYRTVVFTLADDSMQGRPASSEYEQISARLIAGWMKASGLKPRMRKFVYTGRDSLHNNTSVNVYALINHRADSTIIIGAHYDHIGLGGVLSRSIGKHDVHNGADDNASGVALMLGLVHHRKAWMSSRYNYVFVAYSAHEIGLFGSTAFATWFCRKYPRIALVVNMDMTGRLNVEAPRMRITGAGTLPYGRKGLGDAFLGIAQRFEEDSLLRQSDARAYYTMGYSCISISSGMHDDYHAIGDDAAKIRYDGIYKLQQWLEGVLQSYPAAPQINP